MKNISDEDLIGYLLGALEPAEEETIQACLEEDLELRERLAELEERMSGLPDRFVEFDPPPGLAEKTLNTISIVDSTINADSDEPLIQPAGNRETVFSNAGKSPEKELRHRNGNWSMSDMIVGAAVCFVIATVLLPSIANSRFQSNLLQCQNNLRTIGYNMASIADSFDGRLMLPADNDQWQASFFVHQMVQAGLTQSTDELICPNDPVKEETNAICRRVWEPVLLVTPDSEFANCQANVTSDQVVSTESIASKSSPRLIQTPMDEPIDPWVQSSRTSSRQMLQQAEAASGSYGFPAPRLSANGLATIAVPGSPNNVLSADAACFDNPGFQSRNHGGRGQNVLLGDLSVKHMDESACLPFSGDHIYTNERGQVQPGISPYDNTIYRGIIWK